MVRPSIIALLVLTPLLTLGAQLRPSSRAQHATTPDAARYVDPFIGTDGANQVFSGNVFPGATMPQGMVQWSPDTSSVGLSEPGGFNPRDPIIRGFSLTHLSGAGCSEYGNFPFLPTVRPARVPPEPNGSPYSDHFIRASEHASPGYYGVTLESGIGVQLSVTTRTGFGRFDFPAARAATVFLDAGSAAGGGNNDTGADDAAVQISGKDQITGQATGGHFCGLNNRYTLYFAAVFDRPFSRFGTWTGAPLRPGTRHASGPHSGAYLQFDTTARRTVQVKIGLSYVSVQNARLNLQRESPGWSFSRVHARARASWNRDLGRIAVSGGTPSARRVFYTALYHSLVQPTTFSDVNGQYIGFDRQVHVARGYTQYANFSGWDIYRSEIPLLAWLVPRRTSDMVQSLLADARQGGWLPKWPVANDYTGEMDGDSADPIIAGAWAFGAHHFDTAGALRAMVKGATQPPDDPNRYIERPGLQEYVRYGYAIPQANTWGSAAETLEYTTDDYAIAQLAAALGHKPTQAIFARRAKGWRLLVDRSTGFIRPRQPDGYFASPFDPASIEGFVEGNAWQYTWMVPYDLPALFRMLGGNAAVTARLDALFAALNVGETSPHYWGGNETDIEVPWEYDFAGRPWRTQEIVRQILMRLYSDSPGGLPGNDDLGAMSSWAVWAMLGLYPEVPALGGFAVGSPLFPRAVIHLPGRTLTIVGQGAAAGSPFVRSLALNGHPYTRTWLPLRALAGRSATLLFNLDSRPNKAWKG